MMKNVFNLSGIFLVLLVGLAVSAFAADADPSVSIVDQSVEEGSLLSFTMASTAADSPAATSPVAFSFCYDSTPSDTTPCTLSVPNANGFSEFVVGTTKANLSNLSSNTAQFNWTPGLTQEGSYTFNVTVADGDSAKSDLFVVTVSDKVPSISVTGSLLIGDSNQDKSNSRHDNDDDRVVNDTIQVTVKNDGLEQVTGLSAVVSLGTDSSKASKKSISLADLNNKITFDKTVLNPGESAIATIVMNLPEKLSATDSNGIAKAWNVANVDFSATRTEAGKTTESVSTIAKLTMQTENKLEIKNARMEFGSQSERLRDGDNVRKVRPGDTVTLEVEVENLFKGKEDVAIEDIDVEVISDGDLDVDEQESPSDLDAEDTDTVTIEFEIDEDVSRGDEGLIIRVTGIDEFGGIHGEEWEITLEIDRVDHEIDIRSVTLLPESVSCQAEAELTVDIRNTGRRNENEVYVRVSSPELNYNQVSQELELDENDESTRRFIIPVPEDLAEGNYRITVDTYYDTSEKSKTDGIILRKSSCGPEAPVVPPVVDEPVVVIPDVPSTPDVEQPVITPPVQEEKERFVDSNAFIVLLVLGYIVVLGGGALVAVKLLKK